MLAGEVAALSDEAEAPSPEKRLLNFSLVHVTKLIQPS